MTASVIKNKIAELLNEVDTLMQQSTVDGLAYNDDEVDDVRCELNMHLNTLQESVDYYLD